MIGLALGFAAVPMGAMALPNAKLAARGAQSSAVCQGGFEWMFNAEGFSPCLAAAYVEGACTTNNWLIQPLGSGNNYDPPNSTTANGCTCSWASYNLLNACTLCQGSSNVLSWVAYQTACGSQASTTDYFPPGVQLPNNTTLPAYAGVNPKNWTTSTFNSAQAKAVQGPDLTPGVTAAPSAASSHKKSIVGPVVGGVVGGVAALGLLVAAILLCLRYNKRRRAQAMGVNLSGGQDMTQRPEHARSLSDSSSKHLYPSLVHGVAGNGMLNESSARVNGTSGGAPSIVHTTYAPSVGAQRPPMAVTRSDNSGVAGHARSPTAASSADLHSINLPYSSTSPVMNMGRVGSPPIPSMSPSPVPVVMEGALSPNARSPESAHAPLPAHDDNDPNAQLQNMISPFMGGVRSPGASGEDELGELVHNPRARMNPPAYTPHDAARAPAPAPGHRVKGSVDTLQSTATAESSNYAHGRTPLFSPGPGSDTGTSVSMPGTDLHERYMSVPPTNIPTVEGGDTLPSSEAVGMGTRLSGTTRVANVGSGGGSGDGRGVAMPTDDKAELARREREREREELRVRGEAVPEDEEPEV